MPSISRSLQSLYPWTKTPIIANAPMRGFARAPLAIAVTQAGGLGFIGADTSLAALCTSLEQVARTLGRQADSSTPLPIGIGFVNFDAELEMALTAVAKYIPAAVWLFAPRAMADLEIWSRKVKDASHGKTAIWVQVGSVADALLAAKLCRPDVIVVQGIDAGGHGLEKGAGIVALFPEVADALESSGFGHIALVAAGGIVDGRGVAAALALGAEGVVMGTRFLAAEETEIKRGYQADILSASDGGQTTVRCKTFDDLRGPNPWPEEYDGRGIVTQSYEDYMKGMDIIENRNLYAEALEKGDLGYGGKSGRLVVWAGTGVGLVHEVRGAREIVEEVREAARDVLDRAKARL